MASSLADWVLPGRVIAPQAATLWFADEWSGCELGGNEVFGHWKCPCVVIGDRSFVLNRKNEALCFVRVTKCGLRERGSFVLNRNWRFGERSTPGWLAGGVGGRALERPRVRFDIFTDSSSSGGTRIAKRCVCTSVVPGEGRRAQRRCGDGNGRVKG